MKTPFLSAVLATVLGVWAPVAAWAKSPAQNVAFRPQAQAQHPKGARDVQRGQPSEQTPVKHGSPPVDAAGGSGATGVADAVVAPIVVPALRPCPVAMVLMAPFSRDCVVTLSGHTPFWVGYVDSPHSRHRYGRSPSESWLLEPPPYAPQSRQNASGILQVAGPPPSIHEQPPISYEPYVPGTAGPPKTFFVIPGCYAGDRPPKKMALPRGCDISKLHSY
jgi:hypothetical protein